MRFEQLQQTDRIIITDNGNRPIRTIHDKDTIGEVVGFALSHSSGWKTPLAGTPVASIGANFYVGKKFINGLGVGSNFLTAQGCGGFQSRDVSMKDRRAIMKLFAVKDPYVVK